MLTQKQQQTLESIEQFIAHHHYAPSMAEIADGIGIESRGVAHRYVKALSAAGWLKTLPGKRRNIELQNKRLLNRKLPLIGKIAAGKPIEAIIESDTVDLVETFLNSKCFALRVKGSSMIEDGIFDGDIVVCEKAPHADNGQIVVALIDNEAATLKRIHHNPDRTVTLIPANARLAPMVYDASRVMIQGIFVGLLRLAR